MRTKTEPARGRSPVCLSRPRTREVASRQQLRLRSRETLASLAYVTSVHPRFALLYLLCHVLAYMSTHFVLSIKYTPCTHYTPQLNLKYKAECSILISTVPLFLLIFLNFIQLLIRRTET